MKKLKIFLLGNKETYNHFTIEKEQSFVKSFKKLLKNLDKTVFLDYVLFNVKYNKKEAEEITTNLKLKNLNDYYEHIHINNYDFDLYIGKKIRLVVYCSLKNRKKFLEQLMVFCEVFKK